MPGVPTVHLRNRKKNASKTSMIRSYQWLLIGITMFHFSTIVSDKSN